MEHHGIHHDTKRGFTIVELLVVIVVVAILAAITALTYIGVTSKAHDSTVQKDLQTLRDDLSLYFSQHGKVPVGATDALGELKFKASQGSYAVSPQVDSNLVYCRDTPQMHYAVAAMSKSGHVYVITDEDSPAQREEFTWGSAEAICTQLFDAAQSNLNFRGYAATDTASGPWRAWVR